MRVMLLEYTPNPEKVVARAANQCYNAGFVGDTYEEIKDDAALITKVLGMGHTSVLEHASFTFAIEGISRACSHQLVRFRHASYSQQSQRYCFLGKEFRYVMPPTIAEDKETRMWFDDTMTVLGNLYAELVNRGIPAEDARFLLPNACETNLIMTMNARELYHAFGLRCCTHAQWEIRDMFNTMKYLVKNEAPNLFANVGAPCETGKGCPEGARSCGRV